MGEVVVKLSQIPAWQEHAQLICAAWQSGVESIIETSTRLIDAREDPEMKHGDWEKVIETLPFDRTTAFRLMKITSNPALSNVARAQHLPASWSILYELSKADPKLIEAKIEDGTITPKIQRKEVRAMLMAPKRVSKPAEEADQTEDKKQVSINGPKLKVPDGLSLLEYGRQLANKETNTNATDARLSCGFSTTAYTKLRTITLLSDMSGLDQRDRDTITEAISVMNSSQQVAAAFAMVKPIADRVWNSSRITTKKALSRDVDKFMDAVAFVTNTCDTISDIHIPPLDQENVMEVNKMLCMGISVLRKLQGKIKEIQ